MDLAAVVTHARDRLTRAGLSANAARLDTLLLARVALGWDAAAWLARSREEPPDGFLDRFEALLARRARHEPIAYIVGHREFYGRDFRVTPDVLIPRPETELVVEEALGVLSRTPSAERRTPSVLDVGTGSGCLAITLSLERPETDIVATDISEEALEVARDNARRLGAGGRLRFVHGAFLAAQAGPFDLIVSNPPYVAGRDRSSLPVEVAMFEPHGALFAGSDGLATIAQLLPLASRALTGLGSLIVEIGQGQLAGVKALLTQTPGLVFDRVRPDLQGIPRVVVATAERAKP